jgi:dTDP-4-amino-4,6-dideoxygalactose transaminase
MQHMLDRGVATRRGIMCIHREAAYSDDPTRFPLINSERAQDDCILLPLFPEMTSEMQRQVVDALREALGKKFAGQRRPTPRYTSARAFS